MKFDRSGKGMKNKILNMIEKLRANSIESGEDSPGTQFSSVSEMFDKIPCKLSYFVFSKNSTVRLLCVRAVRSNCFEGLIICVIVCSAVKLVLDTYWLGLPEDSTEMWLSSVFDTLFICVFTMEFAMKSVAYGFV